MNWINFRLLNFLTDKQCPERIVCKLVKNELRCFFQGGDYFSYNKNTKEIKIKQTALVGVVSIDTKKIDTETLDKIIEKLLMPVVKKKEDDLIKEKYNIKTKRLTNKDKAKISQYENLFESNRIKSSCKAT